MEQTPIRIGEIKFTNVWPIYFHFPKEKFAEEAEFITQVPAELNRAMRKGEIDMGAISSFAFGQAENSYILMPDLSVSAYGAVKSILFFHKRPLEELTHARIALPTTSATSVHLLKIILKRFYGADPHYFYAAPDLDMMLKDADAALLIGDHAIQAKWKRPDLHVTDLGELWKQWTGCWMTFAVWAIRKETVRKYPALVQRILNAFLASKEKGMRNLKEIVDEAVRKLGGTETYWHDYFSNLNFDFGPEQQEGLSLYFRYAKELGYIRKPVELQLLPKQEVI